MTENTALAVNGFPTLAEVVESPNDFLGKLDIGALNLMCAAGLPGAEDLDNAHQIRPLSLGKILQSAGESLH